jgi:hypothetical protein
VMPFHKRQRTERGGRSVRGNRHLQCVEQSCVAERLVEEIHRTLVERLLVDVFILLGGDEDYRDLFRTAF